MGRLSTGASPIAAKGVQISCQIRMVYAVWSAASAWVHHCMLTACLRMAVLQALSAVCAVVASSFKANSGLRRKCWDRNVHIEATCMQHVCTYAYICLQPADRSMPACLAFVGTMHEAVKHLGLSRLREW